MSRTTVVTGAASGIGKATAELLRERGETVIGTDLKGSDISADLSTAEGRESLVEQVRERSGGTIDAVIAVAGLTSPAPAVVAVNYFGMVASLEGLRPLLAGSDAPRAVAVASMASVKETDDKLVELLAAGDEAAALEYAEVLAAETEPNNLMSYSSSKKAFAQWIRRSAPTEAWAGGGIPLNAIAPGMIITPLTAPLTATEESRAEWAVAIPMPLNGFAEAIVPAYLLAWLASVENSHLCGQVVFVDGGSDVVLRGDSTW